MIFNINLESSEIIFRETKSNAMLQIKSLGLSFILQTFLWSALGQSIFFFIHTVCFPLGFCSIHHLKGYPVTDVLSDIKC